MTLCLIRQVFPTATLELKFLCPIIWPESWLHLQITTFYRYLDMDMETLMEGMGTGLLGPTKRVNLPGVVEEGIEVERKGNS